MRVPVHPMSVFWQKKGCLFSGKNQRFIKIRVLFWPEISALGVFFNFDNERMHPPKYPSDPPGMSRSRPRMINPVLHNKRWDFFIVRSMQY